MNEKWKCQPITNKPDGYIMTRGKQEHTEVKKQDQVLYDAFWKVFSTFKAKWSHHLS